jgi:nitroreductase/NAD-dependent dihydropyrimidine dehydrogenase PreA subunit
MLLEKLRLTIDPPTTYARFSVDDEQCTGCGRCADACPMQILAVVDGTVRSNDRYPVFKCITCQNCVASCSKGAINIEGDYRVHRGFWKNVHLFDGTKTLPVPPANARGESYEHFRAQVTETERVILTRRSIRLYRKKPVETDKLNRIIEAGRFAPSAGNNQPWKFVVIRNGRVIDEVNDLCKKALRKGSYLLMPHAYLDKRTPGPTDARYTWWQKLVIPLLSIFRTGDVEPRARGGINTATSDPGYHIFFEAPVLILLLADRRGIGSVQLDTGICGQNMVLAAHAMGLGTCWVSLVRGLNFHPDYLKKLGVEEPFEVITSIAVGYPAGRIDGVVAREPARVQWVD